jgi:hypothetical protein
MPKLPVIYNNNTVQPLRKTTGTTGLNGYGKPVAAAKAVINLNTLQPLKLKK